MLRPNRPPLISSIVAAILAAMTGCSNGGDMVAIRRRRRVEAASAVITETESSVKSQKRVAPPNPRHFDMENRKS